ncbi:MAG: MBL fold metallo-hydrolase [Desulfobacteraceae bacterium]|nr:MAG: MBL fold metallo-hydrolase [Desulfobacteraceae bacterium]
MSKEDREEIVLSMLKEVDKNIYLVEGENEGRFPFCHSVLITDRITALIETGCGRNRLADIEKEFTPDMVIYSHGHPDHCAGSSFFPPERLWGPEECKEINGNIPRMAERFVNAALQRDWIYFMRKTPELRDFKVGNYFGREHVFDLGDTVMKAVFAPGHTEDHYCFYLPHEKIMLTTDIDLTSFGPWYANPESDLDAFIDSIERVKGYDIETVISSHLGVIRDDIQERFDQFLSVFKERDEKIIGFLSSPRSMADFVEEALIYQKYPYAESILRFFEFQMMSKHLDRLMSNGLVTKKEGKFFRA